MASWLDYVAKVFPVPPGGSPYTSRRIWKYVCYSMMSPMTTHQNVGVIVYVNPDKVVDRTKFESMTGAELRLELWRAYSQGKIWPLTSLAHLEFRYTHRVPDGFQVLKDQDKLGEILSKLL